MAIDNTHTKYLKGKDKKIWNDYKETFDAQRKLDSFGESLLSKIDLEKLQGGEVIDIPIRHKKDNNK